MRKRRFVEYSLLGGLLLLMATNVSAAGGAAGEQIKARASEIAASTSGSGKTVLDPRTGYARFVGSEMSNPIPAKGTAPGASPEAIARSFLDNYGNMFGITDQFSALAVERVREADRGRSFVRFQQVYQQIPVFGGEFIVQTLESGDIVSANGRILPEVAVGTTPATSGEAAVQKALGLVAKIHEVDAAALSSSKPELWVFNPTLVGPGLDLTSLVWRVEVTPSDLSLPIRELVLVDAHAGFVRLNFNQVPNALNRQIYTKNSARGDTLPGTPVRMEGAPATGDADTDKAYQFSGDTYNFYATNHGRDSINNAGMALISTVKFCTEDTAYACPFPGAFWNGSQMVYGADFSSADDVVAHELTHGVTENESNLFYYYQSGAINESFSDVWGEFVDLSNGLGNDTPAVRWLTGEDLPTGAVRSMKDPTLYSHPDRMGSTHYYCGAADLGGVHENSGVNNKAAYLIVDGGTFNGKTVTGMGITIAAKVYYEAQSNLLVSGSDYPDLYNALQQACTNLIGTSGITAAHCQQVTNALDAVEMGQPPASCATNDAPVCPAGQTPSTLYFDNMENAASGNWSMTAAAGGELWRNIQEPYATSGTRSLYAWDADYVTDLSAAMTTSVSIPAGADPVYLRFNHAYDIEANYDGGVVEYSTNGGGSWNDSAALFTENGYNAVVSSEYANPLGGRQAFSDISRGYLSSRMNLQSLKGSNVRFRFRMGTDSLFGQMGWIVDDVKVYKCSAPSSAWRSGESDLGGSWKWTAWFGYYNTTYYPWIYHAQHGWLFPYDDGSGGVFFWYNDMQKFVWTTPGTYPFLYRWGGGDTWLWYLKDSSNPRYFMNYGTGNWEAL